VILFSKAIYKNLHSIKNTYLKFIWHNLFMNDKNKVSIIAQNPDGVIEILTVSNISDEEYYKHAKSEKNAIGVSVQDIFVEEAKKLGMKKEEFLTVTGARSFFNNKEHADRIKEVINSIKVLLEKEKYKSPFEILGGSPGLGRNKS
jgi:hypothetical protein